MLWCSPSVLSTKRSSYMQYLCKSHFGRLFVQSHFPNNYHTKDSLVSMDKYRAKLVLSVLEREGIPGKLLLFISTTIYLIFDDFCTVAVCNLCAYLFIRFAHSLRGERYTCFTLLGEQQMTNSEHTPTCSCRDRRLRVIFTSPPLASFSSSTCLVKVTN